MWVRKGSSTIDVLSAIGDDSEDDFEYLESERVHE
jgi:hypothetical protein